MTTIFDFLISPAHAQAAPGGGGFDFMSILPLALIFVVFYFFLIRPQQKKTQEQRNMLSALRRGDRIITSGGLMGVITKVVSDQELQVEIAEGIKVRIARAMVADCLSKTEPMPEKTASASSEKKATSSKSTKKSTTKKTTTKTKASQ